MRYTISLVALLFALSVSAAPLSAQGRGKGHVNKPDHSKPAKPAEAKKTTNPHKAPKAINVASAPITSITPTTPTTRPMKNPRLESRLLTLLPPGTNVHDASQGFKNWGQFVAAAHASNNLKIPFAYLRAQMTGPHPVSLGQAVQTLKGGATSESGTLTRTKIRNEIKRAEDAANADLRRSRDRS